MHRARQLILGQPLLLRPSLSLSLPPLSLGRLFLALRFQGELSRKYRANDISFPRFRALHPAGEDDREEGCRGKGGDADGAPAVPKSAGNRGPAGEGRHGEACLLCHLRHAPPGEGRPGGARECIVRNSVSYCALRLALGRAKRVGAAAFAGGVTLEPREEGEGGSEAQPPWCCLRLCFSRVCLWVGLCGRVSLCACV